MSKDTYGIDAGAGGYVDVSYTERGAKAYATRHGYSEVYIRPNNGYFTDLVATWDGKRWVDASALARPMREYSQESGRKFRVQAIAQKDGLVLVTLFELNGSTIKAKIATRRVNPPIFRKDRVTTFRYVVSVMFDDVCRQCESSDPELYDALQIARAEIDRRASERDKS